MMLNEICKHVLGIDMKWSVKPLHDKRVAVPNDFNPGTLMPVFEELVESFDEKNKKVGESYVTINKDVCTDGWPAWRIAPTFGLESSASIWCVVWLEMPIERTRPSSTSASISAHSSP